MRFDGPIETGPLYKAMPGQTPSNLGAEKTFRKERAKYIHRCPFSHCPHHETLNSSSGSDFSRRLSTNTLTAWDGPSPLYGRPWAPLVARDDSRQGHFVSRGGAQTHKVPTQFRKNAISYMINQMKVSDLHEKIQQQRLLDSIQALEKQIFEDSDSKNKYVENLATKLSLISRELERRRENSAREQRLTTPQPNPSPYPPASLKRSERCWEIQLGTPAGKKNANIAL